MLLAMILAVSLGDSPCRGIQDEAQFRACIDTEDAASTERARAITAAAMPHLAELAPVMARQRKELQRRAVCRWYTPWRWGIWRRL